jgi:hypothetical protein
MPQFLPSPLRTGAGPIAELLRKVAALQAENARLRKALADERRCVDILLAIDALSSAGEVQRHDH